MKPKFRIGDWVFCKQLFHPVESVVTFDQVGQVRMVNRGVISRYTYGICCEIFKDDIWSAREADLRRAQEVPDGWEPTETKEGRYEPDSETRREEPDHPA